MKDKEIEMQKRIDEIQELYRQWNELFIELEKGEEQWEKGRILINKMERFYFDGEYSEYLSSIEEREVRIDFRTGGEYSIMSEDALWTAFCEHRELAWRRLRSTLKVLDKEST